MADPIRVLSHLDLDLNQLMNAIVHQLATDPSAPESGQLWHNTGSGRFKFHNGTVVEFVVTPASTDTLTNKSIDASANTLSNLAVASFAPSAITADLSAGTSSQFATADVIWTAIQGAVSTANAFTLKGNLDCSANPNYPAGDAGDAYLVSVAGKIGGASGVNVEVGDLIVCKTDGTLTGDQASVGSDWFVIQRNLEAASTTVAGFVRLATSAETQAGTANDIAVTPAGLDAVGYLRSYTAIISNSTGGTISVATHGLSADSALNAVLYVDGTPPKQAIADISIDTSTGAVTWASNKAISGRLLIQGH
jgi:hypothetical protein